LAPRKVTKEAPHELVAGAKTSLFAKIYTPLLYVSKFFNAYRSSFTYALRYVRIGIQNANSKMRFRIQVD